MNVKKLNLLLDFVNKLNDTIEIGRDNKEKILILLADEIRDAITNQRSTVEIIHNGQYVSVPIPTISEMRTAKQSKLDAVKAYKDRTGQGLLQSKLAIEAEMKIEGMQ